MATREFYMRTETVTKAQFNEARPNAVLGLVTDNAFVVKFPVQGKMPMSNVFFHYKNKYYMGTLSVSPSQIDPDLFQALTILGVEQSLRATVSPLWSNPANAA